MPSAEPLTGNLAEADGSRSDGGGLGRFVAPGVPEGGVGSGEGSVDGPAVGLVDGEGGTGPDGAALASADASAGDGAGDVGGLPQPLRSERQISDLATSLAIRGTTATQSMPGSIAVSVRALRRS